MTDQKTEQKTLRDEFAMAALQGLLANSGGPVQQSPHRGWALVNCTLAEVASEAFAMADAMMAARAANKEPSK